MGCSSSTEPTSISYHGGDDVIVKDFHDKFDIGEKIGQGCFAQIYIASEKKGKKQSPSRTGTLGTHEQQKAVKITSLQEQQKANSEGTSKKKNVFSESRVWKHIGRHRNCMYLFEAFYTVELCYMVTEKCDADLGEHLLRRSALNEQSIGDYFLQMLTAIEYLHSIHVVHRDIKTDNFMVGGDDGKTVKLGDFGFSILRDQEATRGAYLVGMYGTAPYMCPEMVCGHGYDEKSDIWSFGVIVYTLLFGAFPYYDRREKSATAMKQAIREGRPPTFKPADVGSADQKYRSDCVVDFAKRLLGRKSDLRPSATDSLKTEYMVAVGQGKHMPGADLPFLHPMVYAAKAARAFGPPEKFAYTNVDVLLFRDKAMKSGGHVWSVYEDRGIDTISNAEVRYDELLTPSPNTSFSPKKPAASLVSTAPSSRDASENGSSVRLSPARRIETTPYCQREKANTDPGGDIDEISRDPKLRSFTL